MLVKANGYLLFLIVIHGYSLGKPAQEKFIQLNTELI
jgi:hypothetical protein